MRRDARFEDELTAGQWELIEPQLPPAKRRGRPRADDRRTVDGILWMLRSGARWKDLPERYGSPSTCHRRLQQWHKEGVWERIWKAVLGELDGKGGLDWRRGFIDGTFAPAKKGGLQSA